ncbi:MAG: cyclic pyranopterin monophosphate synthase MoaC [Clostridia bacterium]|nr:cyclic pyranopterin monophosphate synthase MoaC [Clostridia bacterium]
MVEVGAKAETQREAVARGEIQMQPETWTLIETGQASKGDVLGVARLAGIMAAKQCANLIPLAHPLLLTGMEVNFRLQAPDRVEIESRVRTTGQTGVEMEALTAVSVAALTIYDMCKAVDRAMQINNIRLIYKDGGKSGQFLRKGEELWPK